MTTSSNVLSYDVFVSDPTTQNVTGLLPNGERHMFPALSTMYGKHDAVLVFPMHLPSNSRCFGSVDSMTRSKSPGSWAVSLTPQFGNLTIFPAAAISMALP